jgi:predicted Fe-Mo cluster-binding NifX family protein
MKIAIPVKTNKENPAVAPLFGKAKWFAFVEEGKMSIEKNPAQGGQAVVRWLLQNGVDTLIIQQIGNAPYHLIKESGRIKIYHTGEGRITIDEIITKFNNNELHKSMMKPPSRPDTNIIKEDTTDVQETEPNRTDFITAVWIECM